MALSKRRSLYYDLESSYGVDPSASGSGYTRIPALSIGDLKPGREHLETNYFTGRQLGTAAIAGVDGWSFDVETPWIGFTTAAGDGVSPQAADWLDDLLSMIFGTSGDLDGEGVGASSTTTNLILDTDVKSIQDVICIANQSAINRAMWCVAITDPADGTYDIAPTLETAPTTAAIAYGTRAHYPDLTTQPVTGAFVYVQDDVAWTLLGGKITAASLSWEAGKMVRFKVSISGDSKLRESKGSLPAITSAGPAITPIKAVRSPINFNDVRYGAASGSLDFGLAVQVEDSTEGLNGRSGHQSLSWAPKLTFDPLYATALEDIRESAAPGRLMVQLGRGNLAGGVVNGSSVYAPSAVASVADPSGDGIQRQSIELSLVDPVLTDTASARIIQVVRA